MHHSEKLIRHSLKDKGGWWPDEDHILLLKAGLLEPSKALNAWQQWLKKQDLTPDLLEDGEILPKIFDPIDEASRQLLPLVHRNLENLNEPFSKRLKGYYRFKWVRNQQHIARADQLCAVLEKSGIPTMLINGLALSLWYYKDTGVRTVNAISILVPFEHRFKAIELLSTSAFQYQLQHQNVQSARLICNDKLTCDIQWYLFQEHAYADADMIFWEKSIMCIVGESTPSRRLSSTYQLFHSLMQGNRWNSPAPIGWVSDCVWIARQHSVDWDIIFTLAEQFQYVNFIKIALPFLKQEFSLDISEEYLLKLEKLIATPNDDYYFKVTTKGPDYGRILTYFWRNYALYSCFVKHQSSTPASFLTWMGRKITQRFKL
ncbi:nucleotidyltransferase family protein [Runella sp.]|uniref:nucleotidyltransferase family protein n=1 Tax=Runella sp. TaxID=1960881 RepID=UPI003D151D4E